MNWFILAVIAFVSLDLFLLSWIIYRRSNPKLTEGELAFVRNTWRLIGAGTNPKNDILEADKLLDFVLQKYGYAGTLGEKLKSAGKIFSDLDGVWRAHKLRNRLAHEINYSPNMAETRAALMSFRQALRDLKLKLDA